MTYSGTAALAAVPFLGLGGRIPRRTVVWLALGAVTLHFAGLVAYAAVSGMVPLSGLSPVLSSLAFLVGLLTLAIMRLTAEPSIVLVASPLVIGLLGIALLAEFGPAPAPVVPAGGWFILHTALSLLGLALLGVAVVAAALYLVQHRELKQRRFGVIFQFVPPLEQLDRLNHLALLVGFPMLTAGVLLALAYTGWSGDPAHVGAGLVSWGALGVIAALRMAGRLRGKRAAYWSVGGFAVVCFAFLMLLALGD